VNGSRQPLPCTARSWAGTVSASRLLLRHRRIDLSLCHATSDSLMRELVEPAESSSRHSQPGRISLEYKRSCCGRDSRCRHWFLIHCNQSRILGTWRASRHMRRTHWSGRHTTTASSGTGHRGADPVVHAVPVPTRTPAPASISAVGPGARVIRGPRLRIRRHPRVPGIAVPSPSAVPVRIPRGRRKVRTPHRATTRQIDK